MRAIQALCGSIAVLLAGVSTDAGAAKGCGGRPVVTTKLDDGTVIAIVVTEAQFKKAPSWAPGKGEPPISIPKVVDLAEKWAKIQYKSYDSARIHSIDLIEFGCNEEPRYWYYRVSYLPMRDGRIISGGDFVAILLDGTTIGPTKVDDALPSRPAAQQNR